MRKIILLFCLLTSLYGSAQKQQWKNYNPIITNCIAIEGNKIWIGTSTGVVVKDMNGVTLAEYSIANGLADSSVRCIAIDSKGNKWFGSCRCFE